MSAPRRIPTDEIEVGRWYRVEDAVPEDRGLWVEEVVPSASLGGKLYRGEVRARSLEAADAAWRYNGPVPDELPPRDAGHEAGGDQ